MAVHARHPFIVVWDDHEFANNTWVKGAENHDSNEGDWNARRAAATQAYFEWMPIRKSVSDRQQRIYRSFQFGDLFDLIMLDTRSVGRDQQLDREEVELMAAKERSLLGTTQEYWLAGELAASKENNTLWRLLGQQVVMSQVFNRKGQMANADAWDGYPACRQRIFDQLQRDDIQNNVILTGDVHSSWANDVCANPFDPDQYDPDTGKGSLAVEFVTPAVSSPGFTDREEADKTAVALVNKHPHIKYTDLWHRGFLIININRKQVVGNWYHLDTVTERSTKVSLVKRYGTELNRPGLKELANA
jgi:alkaline phosphatase D